MDVERWVVAVDGPSGSGKSTVSRRLARELAAAYLDTGAMYRAVTWAVLQAGVDPTDSDGVAKVATEATITPVTDPHTPAVRLDGVDVSAAVRTREVTAAVSVVAAVPAVRRQLVAQQRAIIDRVPRIVVEGRDIGAVVAPAADLKVFLTADAGERARRRSLETAADPGATAAELARRDQFDRSRAADPLRQTAEAVALDTTALDIDTVVATLRELLARVREARG